MEKTLAVGLGKGNWGKRETPTSSTLPFVLTFTVCTLLLKCVWAGTQQLTQYANVSLEKQNYWQQFKTSNQLSLFQPTCLELYDKTINTRSHRKRMPSIRCSQCTRQMKQHRQLKTTPQIKTFTSQKSVYLINSD